MIGVIEGQSEATSKEAATRKAGLPSSQLIGICTEATEIRPRLIRGYCIPRLFIMQEGSLSRTVQIEHSSSNPLVY